MVTACAVMIERAFSCMMSDGWRVFQQISFTREAFLDRLKGWIWSEHNFGAVLRASPPDLDLINHLTACILWQVGFCWREAFLTISFQKPWAESLHCSLLCGGLFNRPVVWSSFIWGWRREAAVFAMCWGAILRVGELLLSMPADADFTVDYVIKGPKTRYRAAYQQSVKTWTSRPYLCGFGWLWWPFSIGEILVPVRSDSEATIRKVTSTFIPANSPQFARGECSYLSQWHLRWIKNFGTAGLPSFSTAGDASFKLNFMLYSRSNMVLSNIQGSELMPKW